MFFFYDFFFSSAFLVSHVHVDIQDLKNGGLGVPTQEIEKERKLREDVEKIVAALREKGTSVNLHFEPNAQATAELTHYLALGHALRDSEEYTCLRTAINTIQNSKEEVRPFIMLDDSSGTGKTQALFGLDYPEELYFVLCPPTQRIYKNFGHVSSALDELLWEDLRAIRLSGRVDLLSSDNIPKGFKFKILGLFHRLLLLMTPGPGKPEHPLQREAELTGSFTVEGMTMPDFQRSHPQFVGLFDEVPPISCQANNDERDRLQLLRNVVRMSGGVCVLSGTDSTCANTIAKGGGSRQENKQRWGLLWTHFPRATQETLRIRHAAVLDALSSSWAKFLTFLLSKSNRPWFIQLFLDCLNLKKYPDFVEAGLWATCRAAYKRIMEAKDVKPLFRVGQLKLFCSAYAGGQSSDWMLTSHFPHIRLAKRRTGKQGKEMTGYELRKPAKTGAWLYSSGSSSQLRSAKLYFSDSKIDEAELDEAHMEAELDEAETKDAPFDAEWKHSEEEPIPLKSLNLCSAARSNLVLSHNQEFLPCAVFPSVEEELLLYLYCADHPFMGPRGSYYTIYDVLLHPVDTDYGLPSGLVLPDFSSPPEASSGTDGKVLETAAAAAMSIASHRSRRDPLQFLEHVVQELLGARDALPLSDSSAILRDFVGDLKVPYALPPQQREFSYEFLKLTSLQQQQPQRRQEEENSEKRYYDILFEMTSPDSSFLSISGECKDWADDAPSLDDLLKQAPSKATHPPNNKWLRIIFCQVGPQLLPSVVETETSDVVVATLQRRSVGKEEESIELEPLTVRTKDEKTNNNNSYHDIGSANPKTPMG